MSGTDNGGGMFRNRIKEMRMVSPAVLKQHPKNWRRHPENQRRAFREMAEKVGYANAVIAYEDSEWGLTLIDGHLRIEESAGVEEVPVLVLDVNRDEAEQLLMTLDPIAMLAQRDKNLLRDLVNRHAMEDEEFQSHLMSLSQLKADTKKEDHAVYPIVPRFSEKHDYVIVVCHNEVDFGVLQTLLNLQPKRCRYNPKHVGIGRVIEFAEFRRAWDSGHATGKPADEIPMEAPPDPEQEGNEEEEIPVQHVAAKEASDARA